MADKKEGERVAEHRQFLRYRRMARAAGIPYPGTRNSRQIREAMPPGRPSVGYRFTRGGASSRPSAPAAKPKGKKSKQMLWIEQRARERAARRRNRQ